MDIRLIFRNRPACDGVTDGSTYRPQLDVGRRREGGFQENPEAIIPNAVAISSYGGRKDRERGSKKTS